VTTSLPLPPLRDTSHQYRMAFIPPAVLKNGAQAFAGVKRRYRDNAQRYAAL